MYRKQIRRRRAVLAILVIVSLALLSAHFGEGNGGVLHGFQRVVAGVLAPIEEGSNRALKPARDLVSWFDETFQARGENKRLRDEAARLRKRVAEAETATAENRQLQRLVKLRQTGKYPQGYNPITGRVIGRSPTVWYATITIDKGSTSGVRVDQPVINGDGLVGRISNTTAGTAQVTLITDHTSAVSAQVVPDGVGGVVKAEVGNPNDLLLDFIEKGKRILKGETVVTAGWRADDLGSLFPRGIPIGRVTKATIEEQETYQRVHIKPFADVRDLDFVQVLSGRTPGAKGSVSVSADRGGGG